MTTLGSDNSLLRGRILYYLNCEQDTSTRHDAVMVMMKYCNYCLHIESLSGDMCCYWNLDKVPLNKGSH